MSDTSIAAGSMVSLTREGSIARLRLEPPEKLDAQTHRMCFELRRTADDIGT